jgi:repressor LexA
MDQKIDRFDGNISKGKSSEGSGPVSQSAVVNTSGGRGLRRPGGKPMLTERQKRVLEYINESIVSRGYPPTLREIGEHMAIRSTNGVNDHLRALEKKGYLERHDLKSRGLRIVDSSWAPQVGDAAAARRAANDNDDFVDVPVLGKVAAGQPILAVENREDTVRVDRFFLGAQRDVFALRVKGDSMIEAGIFDGDFLFVKKQPTAHSGDIVVAMINEEATVKYFHPESDRIVFKPGNSRMHPIEVKKSDFKPVNLLGTVVGVYRKMC